MLLEWVHATCHATGSSLLCHQPARLAVTLTILASAWAPARGPSSVDRARRLARRLRRGGLLDVCSSSRSAARGHPCGAFLYHDTWSFPSGHAMGSLIGYGMLAYVLTLLWIHSRGGQSPWCWAPPCWSWPSG